MIPTSHLSAKGNGYTCKEGNYIGNVFVTFINRGLPQKEEFAPVEHTLSFQKRSIQKVFDVEKHKQQVTKVTSLCKREENLHFHLKWDCQTKGNMKE